MGKKEHIKNTKLNNLYSRYMGIKNRCYNPNDYNSYKNYGKRGIKMCDEWFNDFRTFEKWALENGYRKELTIERIDFNGDYEPSNCTWVTREQQSKNTSRNHYINYNGKKYILTDLAKEFGILWSTLKRRLEIQNMSLEEAIFTPISSDRKTKTINVYEYETKKFIGRYNGIRKVARLFDIDSSSIVRILNGTRNQTKGYYFRYSK